MSDTTQIFTEDKIQSLVENQLRNLIQGASTFDGIIRDFVLKSGIENLYPELARTQVGVGERGLRIDYNTGQFAFNGKIILVLTWSWSHWDTVVRERFATYMPPDETRTFSLSLRDLQGDPQVWAEKYLKGK